jgi:hypothetical protein
VPLNARYQTIPIEASEEGPCSDGANVDARGAPLVRRSPAAVQPAQLIFSRASKMCFRDRNWAVIACPRIFERSDDPRGSADSGPHRLHINVWVQTVASSTLRRMTRHVIVQVAITRYIVIDANDVGRTRMIPEPFELGCRDPGCAEVAPHSMLAIHHSS